jgi:hypothetical protein
MLSLSNFPGNISFKPETELALPALNHPRRDSEITEPLNISRGQTKSTTFDSVADSAVAGSKLLKVSSDLPGHTCFKLT